VGGLVAKHPKGDLAAGAYMEVPYLDVLRTITKRTLPLTDIETDEFGLPEQRISDFASALEWSPMELLADIRGAVKMWQIVRTGLNDSEVFAYESAKWVERCGGSAYLAIEDGQGHFVSGAVGLRQQAADLAIVDSFLSG
jgi:protease II